MTNAQPTPRAPRKGLINLLSLNLSGVGQRAAVQAAGPGPRSAADRSEVVCEERFGGLLKHFSRSAA